MTDESIFAAALELPTPEEQAASADGACDGPEQRERLRALLAAHARAGGFLDRPAVGAADAEDTRTANPAGTEPDDEDATAFLAPSGRPDSLGRLGHYEVLKVLGRGGFGIVFRAFDDILQRVVAVKVMAPHMAATSPARKRFLREARSAAAVDHPNVVRVYAVEEQPLPHLAMEFVAGETLQQRMTRTGPLDTAEVLRLGRQIAGGLAAAHGKGLIHRDIKPSNILIDAGPHPSAKITDFGLARAADDASLTRSGVVAGTPMYMAPEQARGEALDHRADLFSLGSVLYVMLTGRPPFRAENTPAVLKRVCDDTPRPIREVIPEVPDWFCRIVEKLHAKDPAERFQTAQEVADLLADCEKQLAERKELTDFARIPAAKAKGKTKRWKWAALAAAAVVFLAVVGVVFALLPHGPHVEDAPRTDGPQTTSWDDPPLVVGPTDLIPLARTEFSRGRWEVLDGKLVHPRRGENSYPALPFVVRAPDEYDLEAEFERTEGGDFIAFNMFAYGHRFQVALDTWKRWAGLQSVDGALINQNPTRRAGPWLTNGRRHVLRCEVRRAGIQAWLDGREVVDYRGGYDALSAGLPDMPDWFRFYLQANDDCGFVIHKLVLTPRPAAADAFTPLFNGKDLTGWKGSPGVEPRWRAQDGALVGPADANADLFSARGDYKDFHLRAEVYAEEGASGGVYVGSAHDAVPDGVCVTVFGHRDEDWKTGGIWGVDATKADAPPVGPNEWFVLDIIRTGRRMETRVNGKKVAVSTDRPDQPGHVVLQHIKKQGAVRFRKVEIKELPASPTPVEPAPKPAVAPFDEPQAKVHQQEWAAHVNEQVEFTDPKLGMAFRVVPPGEFLMGSAERQLKGDGDTKDGELAALIQRGYDAESPPHKVRISRPFAVGKCEVTVGQFRKFVEAEGYVTTVEAEGGCGLVKAELVADKKFSWKSVGYTQADLAPVWNVSAEDAEAFCRWLSKETGRTFRLPTEAEWEWACRGGTAGRTFFPEKDIHQYAWGPASKTGKQGESTAKKDGPQTVGQRSPNPFGLHDTCGNVWEWCADWYGERVYKTRPADAATADPTGPPAADRGRKAHRVQRGGSAFHLGVVYSNSTARPVAEHPLCGFRVVMELSAK